MKLIEGRWFAQGADLTAPLRVRQAVFGRGADALDALAQQVVVYGSGEPVGTARLWWQDGDFWAGDVGVLPAYRGQGYGDLLVRLLLYKAVSHNARSVCLTCPVAMAPFFARYGFIREGEAAGDTVSLRARTDVPDGCAHCGAPQP